MAPVVNISLWTVMLNYKSLKKSWFDELDDAQNNFTVEQSVFFLFIGCFRSSMNF